MSTVLTCDHCHQPIIDPMECVRIHISNPVKIGRIGQDKGKSLAERAQAAAAAAQAVAGQPDGLDLHIHCFDEVLAPVLERIGK